MGRAGFRKYTAEGKLNCEGHVGLTRRQIPEATWSLCSYCAAVSRDDR